MQHTARRHAARLKLGPYLIFADGLHLLIDVLVEELHGLGEAGIVALGVQDIYLQLGQLILQLDHHHLLIIHCIYTLTCHRSDVTQSGMCYMLSSLKWPACSAAGSPSPHHTLHTQDKQMVSDSQLLLPALSWAP